MIAYKVVPGEESIMKVRVQYTIEVSESELRALEHRGNGRSRDDVKQFLMEEGVGGWELLLQRDWEEQEEYRNRSEDYKSVLLCPLRDLMGGMSGSYVVQHRDAKEAFMTRIDEQWAKGVNQTNGRS